MEIWQYLLLAAGAVLLVALITASPERFLRLAVRLGVNAAAGLALLLAVDGLSGLTGLALPLNGFTLAVAAALGAPGVAACAVLAAV